MKKSLLSAAILCSLCCYPIAYAGDCFSDPVYDQDWNAVVTTAAYHRDVACMEGSEIIGTMPVGEVIHVIAVTDGWYKVERDNGDIGWVGQWLVEETSQAFNYVGPFSDVDGHMYEDAILNIYEEGIVQGYDDGTYQPDRVLNRAELLKIIVEAAYDDEFEGYEDVDCFTDVSGGEWYTGYVCFAKAEGIVEGYSDDSFRPSQEINFVEALKITMIGFDYEYVEGDPWYQNLVDEAEENDFIPGDIDEYGQDLTRGQMAELITRILAD